MAEPSAIGRNEYGLTAEELLRMERIWDNFAASAVEFAKMMEILQAAVDVKSANQARTQEEGRSQDEPVVSSTVPDEVTAFIEEANPPMLELMQQQPQVKSFAELLQQLSTSTDFQERPNEEILRKSTGQETHDQLLEITILPDAERNEEERENDEEIVKIAPHVEIESVDPVWSSDDDEEVIFLEEIESPIIFYKAIMNKRKRCSECNKIMGKYGMKYRKHLHARGCASRKSSSSSSD